MEEKDMEGGAGDEDSGKEKRLLQAKSDALSQNEEETKDDNVRG